MNPSEPWLLKLRRQVIVHLASIKIRFGWMRNTKEISTLPERCVLVRNLSDAPRRSAFICWAR